MLSIRDQLNNPVELKGNARRIVSLVPSQTELLHYLGLEDEVVGITKFCVHPQDWFNTKKRVGGTKNVHVHTIKALQPDLIIGNKEENVKDEIEALMKIAPVWLSDISKLDDALKMIAAVGSMTGTEAKALELCNSIEAGFSNLETVVQSFMPSPIIKQKQQVPFPKIKAAYLIWQNPFMAAGANTFINDMLNRCGFHNIFGDSERYPMISIEDISAAQCELLILSSEPFPFTQQHVDELQPLLPASRILLADGQMFSWYGSRLVQATAYFKDILTEIKGNRLH